MLSNMALVAIRKAELVSAHKKATTAITMLHITTELVNTPNLTALIYSLANGVYHVRSPLNP